jgi:GT2 family glycosyltransferase
MIAETANAKQTVAEEAAAKKTAAERKTSAMVSKADVSIVIVTWNGKKYALECLDSLRALNTKLALEIIVVDNASSDGTPDVIEQQYPEVKLFRNSDNLGFAKANNSGIAASCGDYVALVNSDVVVPPGCLEKMVDYMKTRPEVGLLGPKMLSPTGEIGQSVNRIPTVWNYFCFALGLHSLVPRSKLFGGYLMADYAYDKTEDVEVLTGWFWMVPRRALEQVGGLDERFFMYGEDLDWSHRFIKSGWRVVFFAEAEALHYGAASSGQAPTRFYVEMVRANLQYFEKHYGRLGGFGFLVATGIHELVRVAAYGALYCVSSKRRPSSALKVGRSISCLKWLARGSRELPQPAGK